MAYFEIKNFYKKFGNLQVLNGIDFTLDKGKALSIIGSSGSGKTTLLRCINFLESADQGQMVLDGEVLIDKPSNKKEKYNDIRKKALNFGLVFQSFNLFPQHSVLKNVTLAPSLLLKDKIKNYKKSLKKDSSLDSKKRKQLLVNYKQEQKLLIEKEANELLEKVGLSDKKNSYPCQLSGGQCQRVAIARALALNPKVLCFDEPTSALDPELTGEVLKVIRSLINQKHTIIIVTHEMGFAKSVSDKIIFMSDGVIEEQGNPKEIFENPKSEKLKSFLSNVENKENI